MKSGIKKYAHINPIMPLYRYGIYKELCNRKDIQIDFFSDTKEMNGIKNLSFNLSKKPIEEGGLRWYKIKAFSYKFKNVLIILWYADLLKVITSDKYDGFIFTESGHSPANWIFPIIARLLKKHVIFWGHGYYGNENRVKSIFRLASIKLANDFLLYGYHAYNLLVLKGIEKKKLHVVYNSLDYNSQVKYRMEITRELTNAKKEKLFSKPDLPVILFIGRLETAKKIYMLLQAAVDLRNGGLDMNVLIIGDGPEREPIINFTKASKLENVRVYGKCYDEQELAVLITLSDVSVSPGNTGLNCIHALMYGTPMITHNNKVLQGPEVEAIKPGFNGDLYEFENQSDLTLKLKKWILNKRKTLMIVRNCYTVVDETYNPKNQADIIVEVLKKRWENGK